jgi:glycosyltransferase involved in cell wall biosynthesis
VTEGRLPDLPLVSIITPSFNQARFIRQTIESVLAQDYPRIEYFVVDGGSTDGTVDILRGYDGRLSWSSERDRGQADAINRGFRHAKGEILAWLNSDDTYLPGAVSAAVSHLVQHRDCAMVYGDGFLIDERGEVTGRFPATEPFNLWKLVYVSDYILQQTTFFRRSAIEAVEYLDEGLHWGLDWDLFIKLGKQFRVDYLPREMANLREYTTTKTSAGGRRRLAELAAIARRHGSRRYPPALFGYGADTYLRLTFETLGRHASPGLSRLFAVLERRLAGPVSRLVAPLVHAAQGYYTDGWVCRRAHFLLRKSEEAGALTVRGRRLPRRLGRRPLRLTATMNGTRLETRVVPTAGPFEVTWRVPPEQRTASLVEVRLDSRPTFRPSWIPLRGDRRRLAFQLDDIAFVD